MANPYRGEIPIDTPMVCINEYKEDRVVKYGLSIRFVSGEDTVFSSGGRANNLGVFKSMPFSDFTAIVKYSDFDPIKFNDNPSHYISIYSTNKSS